jgi:twinkle protein
MDENRRYTKGPCPFPGCGSSDAFASYTDSGIGHCFSCGKSKKVNNEMNNYEPITFTELTNFNTIGSYSSYPITSRGISKKVVDHFEIKMSVDQYGKPESHFYPYTKNGIIVAYKERKLPKEFRTHGDFKDCELFGQSACTAGKHRIVITEGELDACAVAQSMIECTDKIWNVVSIPSASNLRGLLEQRDWINSFREIVLCFDQDDAGQKAQDAAAKMFNAGKVKVARLNEKDPCEVLKKHGGKVLNNAIFTAQTWSPAGIVTGEAIWKQFKDRQNVESIPYPDCLNGLNEKLKGIRYGEITLFTSGTGSGKSTVIKEIVLNLLAKTNDKIGLISLEESVGDTAEKFISMALKRNIMDPPPTSEEELRRGYEAVFGDQRLVLLDHQGSVGDSSLIDKIEYMALMGCKYLVLDHITIAVSEGSEGLSGNEAVDKVMSDLLKVVKKHNVWLGLISHLRKAQGGKSFEEGNIASIDDIKGSGSIKQISFDIIAFSRNLIAESEDERNTIKFKVLKSRFTGLTGSAGSATYNNKTTRLAASGGFDEYFTI